jgi:hypothetical protein
MTTVTEQTKQCRKCQQFLPLGNFTKKSANKDGLNSWCRTCWGSEKREVRSARLQRIRNRLGRSQKRQRVEKTDDELRSEARQRRNIFVPLEPVVREEPIWIREERKIEEPKQPEPEQKRIEPKLAPITETATEQEQRDFVRSFVTEYIAKNGETCDEFFLHWISYHYPEIDRELIRRTVAAMVKSGRLKVSRKDRVDNVCFLVLV